MMVAVAAVVALFQVSGCSDESSNSGGGGSGNSTSSGTGGSGNDTGGTTDTGGFHLGGGTPGGCGCSADLKKVVCDGIVTETCSGDQACLSGECSDDPCGAATASKSSYGCDYWALRPDVINAVEGSCFAAFVANTWP